MALDRTGLGDRGALVGPFVLQLFDEVERLQQVGGLTEPPQSPDSPGQKGMIAVDQNFLYVCYDANKWGQITFTINF